MISQGPDQGSLQFLLLSDGAVPVDALTSKKAMTLHTLAKQKKDDCQDDHKHELSNSERGWLSSCRVLRFQVSCHQSYLSPGQALPRDSHSMTHHHFPCRRSNCIAPHPASAFTPMIGL